MNKDFKNGIIGLLMFMGIILLLGFISLIRRCATPSPEGEGFKIVLFGLTVFTRFWFNGIYSFGFTTRYRLRRLCPR